MSTLILPNTFANETTADAVPVEENFTFIEGYTNSEVIVRDGAIGMTGALRLFATPTQPLHAATKSYVDAIMPVGVILPFGGSNMPNSSWMACNGALLNRTTYEDLFTTIGIRFGNTTADNFRLPNMTGRVLIGVDPTDTTDPRTDAIGQAGGTTTPPLLQHQHDDPHGHTAATSLQSATHTHSIDHNHAAATTTSDGNHTHDSGYRGTDANAGSVLLDGAIGTPGSTQLQGVLAAGAHTHTLDLPNFTGASGINLGSHTHTVTIANYTGDTGNTVQDADTKYRPPYLTVNFIIKVL